MASARSAARSLLLTAMSYLQGLPVVRSLTGTISALLDGCVIAGLRTTPKANVGPMKTDGGYRDGTDS